MEHFNISSKVFLVFPRKYIEFLSTDYFRESSSGSCLPCSKCPDKNQHLIVPECQTKHGMEHPNICWPGYAGIEQTSKILGDTGKTFRIRECFSLHLK